MISFKAMDREDRYAIVGSVIVPALLWWLYVGRHKYNTKGMK